jgi:hypothetical protein
MIIIVLSVVRDSKKKVEPYIGLGASKIECRIVYHYPIYHAGGFS